MITEISEYFIISAVLALSPLFVPQQAGIALRMPSFAALFFYTAAALFLFLRGRSTQSGLSALSTAEPGAACSTASGLDAAALVAASKPKAAPAFCRKAALERTMHAVFSFAARLLLYFCALACSAVLWNLIASAAGESPLLENATGTTGTAGAAAVRAVLFGTPGGTFRFVSGIIVLASYEEMLYRFFLPEKARRIVSLAFADSFSAASDPEKTRHAVRTARISHVFYALAEVIPVALFALAHRYLGVYAVGNALCAAVILRTAFCKKVPIGALCAVHAAYNAVTLIALYVI